LNPQHRALRVATVIVSAPIELPATGTNSTPFVSMASLLTIVGPIIALDRRKRAREPAAPPPRTEHGCATCDNVPRGRTLDIKRT
jgi:LPXTG-motif cell wall-anchored protein